MLVCEYSTTSDTGCHPVRYQNSLLSICSKKIITHNLEHGNIVISYNLPSEGHAARLQAVIDNLLLSGNWGVVRSYEGIPEGQIVLSAWGRMFRMGAIDQESIEAFFALYAGELGPERIPC